MKPSSKPHLLIRYLTVCYLFLIQVLGGLFSRIRLEKLKLLRLLVILFASFSLVSIAEAADESLDKVGVVSEVLDNGASSKMDWIVSHANNTNSIMENISLTDKLEGSHTYIPSSLQLPEGWSAEYSTDAGASFTASASAANINALRFNNDLLVPNGKGRGKTMSIPFSGGVSLSGAGDGYNATITDSGKFVGLNHHTVNSGIWCYDSQAEKECPGYKKYPGIAGGNTSGGVAVGNKVYFTNSTGDGGYSQNGKIRCWDTDTDTLCGDSPYIGAYVGPIAFDKKLYVVKQDGTVGCYDTDNNLAQCAGSWPKNIGLSAFTGLYSSGGELIKVNKKFYISTLAGQLSCFDTATQSVCSGWASPKATPSAKTPYNNAFLRLNAAGAVTGVCARPSNSTNSSCWDLDGTASASLTISNGANSFQYDYGLPYSEVYVGSRMFMGTYNTQSFTCWDFATNAPCTGSSYNASGISTASNNGAAYSLTTDGSCVYTYGDSGILKSWDPDTGATPCVRSNGNMTVTMENYSCDGLADNTKKWNKIKFFDTNLTSGVDFTSLKVKALDADTGDVLLETTEVIDGTGEVDISSISSDVKSIKLLSVGKPVGKNAWNDGVPPKVSMTFTSDKPTQFCYKTAVTCAAGDGLMRNTVTTNITDGVSATASVAGCNPPPDITSSDTVEFTSESTDIAINVESTDDSDVEKADGTGLVYSLSGGEDVTLFDIDAVGNISFKTPPLITDPKDSDKDNFYKVEVSVADQKGALTKQLITIEVIIDTDGDGVKDKVDLDDDNDGILDVDEGRLPVGTGTWNFPSKNEARSTLDLGNGVTVIVTNTVQNFTNGQFNPAGDDVADKLFWSQPNLAGKTSLQNVYKFEPEPEIVTFRFEETANPGTPVSLTNPILHIDRIGGFSGASANAAKINLLGGLTWTELAGTLDFLTTDTTATDESAGQSQANPSESNWEIIGGTASGSLRINGTISTFQLKMEPNGPLGIGDGIEFIIEAEGLAGVVGRDSDDDGIPDYQDLDSDGDGIPDNIEAQSTAGYIPPNRTYTAKGVDTAYGDSGLIPYNKDGTDKVDYLDNDSDNDGTDDIDESGLVLTGTVGANGLDNGVDTADDYSDVNGNAHDGTDLKLADMDAAADDDAEPDYRDTDNDFSITKDDFIGIIGETQTLDVLANDSGIVPSTIRLLDKDNNEVTELIIPNEGTWTVDTATGQIKFAPVAGNTEDPTPVKYLGQNSTSEKSEAVTITLDYPDLFDYSDAPTNIEGFNYGVAKHRVGSHSKLYIGATPPSHETEAEQETWVNEFDTKHKAKWKEKKAKDVIDNQKKKEEKEKKEKDWKDFLNFLETSKKEKKDKEEKEKKEKKSKTKSIALSREAVIDDNAAELEDINNSGDADDGVNWNKWVIGNTCTGLLADGTVGTITMTATTYCTTIKATNNADVSAQMVAWLDFNVDGTFDKTAERSVVDLDADTSNDATQGNVPAGTIDQDVVLYWENQTQIVGEFNSYVRVRFTTDTVFKSDHSPEPTNPAADGETEDTAIRSASADAPTTNDDVDNFIKNTPTIIDVLANDVGISNPLDVTTVKIMDGIDQVTELVVANEGTWTANADGTITFTPLAEFKSDTTPISYIVSDTVGEPSNPATVNVYIDTDGDDIADNIDLDDDNDGILDSVEGEATTVTMTLDPANSVNGNLIYTGTYKGQTETITVTVPASHPGLVGPNGTEETNKAILKSNGDVELWDLGSPSESVLLFNSSLPINELVFTNLEGFDNFPNSARDAIAFDKAGSWYTTNGAQLAEYDPATGNLVSQNPNGNASANMSDFSSSGLEFVAKGAKSPLYMRSPEGGTTNGANVKFIADNPFTSIALLYEDVSQNGAREYVASKFSIPAFEITIIDPAVDSDNDKIPDYLDLDSDGDGIPDNIEAQTTAGYIAPSNTYFSDGTDKNYVGGLTPNNNDLLDTPDYLDLESDNVAPNDTTEAGITLEGADDDGDGLDNAVDTDDVNFGPVNAGITDVLNAYPKIDAEVKWRVPNTPPEITSPNTKDVPENQTAVMTITATDIDDDTVTFELTDGVDKALFELTPQGVLTFKAAPDFENPDDALGATPATNNVYEIEVTADDNNGGLDVQTLLITVTDVNDPPVITSAETSSVDENTKPAITVTSTDQDPNETAAYSITGGVDGNLFSIDASTGDLAFIDAPNYEKPLDVAGTTAAKDNVYEVEVTVTDSKGATDVQLHKVTVNDVVEPPEFLTPPSAFDVPENRTHIATVTAIIEDDVNKTFSITGGADQAIIDIDSATGELVFNENASYETPVVAKDPITGELIYGNASNFENPVDVDGDNVYEIEITITDANGLSTMQATRITVTDVNDIPTAAGETLSTDEDTAISDSASGDVHDQDGDALTFTLASDVQHGTLDFNPVTGDYSYMPSAQFFGTDSFVYRVTDPSGEEASAKVTITVNPVEDAPAVYLNTNYGISSTLDWNTHNWGNAQYSQFIVDGVAVNMNFGGTSPYVSVSDNVNITGGLGATEQSLSWTIDPRNKAETGKLVISFDRPVANVSFSLLDIDSGNSIPSSQMEQMTVDGLFVGEPVLSTLTAIDANAVTVTNNQLLAAAASPVVKDSNKGNVDVQFSGLVDTVVITYGSQAGANQNPAWLDFAISDLTFEKAQMDNTVLFIEDEPAVLITDPSAAVYDMLEGDIVSLKMDFTTLADGADEIISVLGESFVLNADKQVTVTNASGVELLIDYKADTTSFTVSAPNGNDPVVDEALSELILSMTYQNLDHTPTLRPNNDDRLLRFKAVDAGGLESEIAVARIMVEAVNDAPMITSDEGGDTAALSVEENQTAVTTVTAMDYEEDNLTFSISGGADAALFTIDPVSGVLSFVSAPDFEALGSAAGDNDYVVEVTVTDDGEDTPSDTQVLTVSVTDVNDAPVIESADTVTMPENTVDVITIVASDQDANDTRTYAITGGADAALFSFNPADNTVVFNDPVDFEALGDEDGDNVYEFEVTVTDAGGLTDTQLHKVTVTDVNDAPVITSATAIELAENVAEVMTVTSTDQDAGDTRSYAITGGDDAALFELDAVSGALTFKAAVVPDFENAGDADQNNVYLLEVTVTDAAGATDVELHTITITDAQDAPLITSADTASVDENTTQVITVTATDQDANPVDTLTFSVSGGDDQALFSIDPTTGELSFKAAPNVEQPLDADADNVYVLEVSVDDGHGNVTTQVITVTVNDVNDAPVFAQASIEVEADENQTAVTTVVASDEDVLPSTDTLTYSIIGGTDSALFDLDSASGVLTFKTAPDFEKPTDTGANPADNLYELEVKVMDGQGGEATQVIHVTVKDVGVRFSLRAILQGPFNGTDMSDDLRILGLIPEQEPYTALGYPVTGDLNLDTDLLAIDDGNAIVDWVLFELREGADSNQVVLTQAALLQRDGDVVMPTSGSAEFSYDAVPAGDYFVSLRHRNHLGVMSEKLTMGAIHVTADFADSGYLVQGDFARLIAGDKAFLWAGDANHDGKVIAQGNDNDLNILLGNILGDENNTDVNTNYVLLGYANSDINMDGKTIFSGIGNDVNPVMGNVLMHPSNESFSANFIVNQQMN